MVTKMILFVRNNIDSLGHLPVMGDNPTVVALKGARHAHRISNSVYALYHDFQKEIQKMDIVTSTTKKNVYL